MVARVADLHADPSAPTRDSLRWGPGAWSEGEQDAEASRGLTGSSAAGVPGAAAFSRQTAIKAVLFSGNERGHGDDRDEGDVDRPYRRLEQVGDDSQDQGERCAYGQCLPG